MAVMMKKTQTPRPSCRNNTPKCLKRKPCAQTMRETWGRGGDRDPGTGDPQYNLIQGERRRGGFSSSIRSGRGRLNAAKRMRRRSLKAGSGRLLATPAVTLQCAAGKSGLPKASSWDDLNPARAGGGARLACKECPRARGLSARGAPKSLNK